jgi:hypothetical protein
MTDLAPLLDNAFRPTEILAAKAVSLALSTARFPPELRECRWVTDIPSEFLKLLPEEIEGFHLDCGFLSPVGWNILSSFMGMAMGFDEMTPVPARLPHALYTPRYNYGGWTRIFRLKAAALPPREDVIGPLVGSFLGLASAGGYSEERVRGVLGIPPTREITQACVREALLASDLFEAPWMVCTWTGPDGWVVEGVASRYKNRELSPDQECAFDLMNRPYADQTHGFNDDGFPILFSGPEMGFEMVIQAIERALRLGYRLDLVWEPIEKPVDAWEDGVKGPGVTPLMGVVIPGPAGYYTIAFQHDGVHARIEGVAESDYQLFEGITGVHPGQPLRTQDFEKLVLHGTPIFGRFKSYAPAVRKD